MISALLLPLLTTASATPMPVARSLPSGWLNPSFGQTRSAIVGYAGESLQNLTGGVDSQGFFYSNANRNPVGGWVGQNGWTVVAQFDKLFGTKTNAQLFHDSETTLSTTSGAGCDWSTPFTDCYNDDNGWAALALITGYDAYGDSQYLDWAKQIYDFTLVNGYVAQTDIDAGKFTTDPWLTAVIPKTCNGNSLIGGVSWKDNTTNDDGSAQPNSINAVSSGLFALQAAELCDRLNSKEMCGYAANALAFIDTHLRNSDNLIIDNVAIPDCTYKTEWVFTYNAGLYIGAYAKLGSITGNQAYITKARETAEASMSSTAPWNSGNGIINSNQGTTTDAIGDGTQFQGILIRNLVNSYPYFDAATQADIRQYVAIQYYGMTQLDSDSQTQPVKYALQWQGPSYDPAVQTGETQIVAQNVLNGLSLFSTSDFPASASTNVPVSHQ